MRCGTVFVNMDKCILLRLENPPESLLPWLCVSGTMPLLTPSHSGFADCGSAGAQPQGPEEEAKGVEMDADFEGELHDVPEDPAADDAEPEDGDNERLEQVCTGRRYRT